MQNLEEEAAALRDDAEGEALKGVWIPFEPKETGRYEQDTSPRQILKNLRNIKDLNSVSPGGRGIWYRGFELALIDAVQHKLKPLWVKYRKLVEEYQMNKVSFGIPALVTDLLM